MMGLGERVATPLDFRRGVNTPSPTLILRIFLVDHIYYYVQNIFIWERVVPLKLIQLYKRLCCHLLMRIARARFKYALRQCRLDEQMIYSNRLAKYMQCHDVNNFWKTVNIRNKSKATLSNCIAGTSGKTNIANM